MRQYISILLWLTILLSCQENSNKEKELELKQKELELKEKELGLNKKDTSKHVTSNISTNKPSEIEDLPKAKVSLTRATKVTLKCDGSNAPNGNHPLIDLYCGALGQKPIEIYITSVDLPAKEVAGYSIVGGSRTNFKGSFTTSNHKAASHQADNVVDVASTIYKLILKEPSQANRNGVFSIDIDISDVGRSGYGTWTSYDGMLYREIKIIDRLNDL
ncbi:hypothetical protein [Parasediminibacterium sp. JCM 36343]|uniref:hypothetical protein n=1 Tax=Parasediminibacterium sp. JCM 36343 TaxID=3374279 RepID=UPI00397E186A